MSLAATQLLSRAGTAPVEDVVPSGRVDIPSSSQGTPRCWLCFHTWSASIAAPWWAWTQQICNILHYVFPLSRRNDSSSVLLGIKSTISLKTESTPVPCFQKSIPPAQCIHKHTTHTTVGTALKKSHSATPGSASKGNVNVKGKVLLVCGISVIQLEISGKILCSLVF